MDCAPSIPAPASALVAVFVFVLVFVLVFVSVLVLMLMLMLELMLALRRGSRSPWGRRAHSGSAWPSRLECARSPRRGPPTRTE